MTNEELILERLDRIEKQIAPVVETAGAVLELKEDLTPLSNQAIRLLIQELQDVESSFQLEDLLLLLKRMMRSVKNMIYALDQLENLIDFVTTIEPLLKSSVPQIINYLDDLEQRGVLRVIQAMLDVRAKIASAYDAEDIEQIGDGAVAMLGLAKKFSDPKAVAFLEKFAEVPSKVDLAKAKKMGPFGLLSAPFNDDVKQGLGIVMELTRALGTLKNGDEAKPTEKTGDSPPS
ncbi:MAG: DUF1641 domain-containing protein [Deltaproteobacteria bacterium]|nr:DUF1641 domain-containing protein [Deltaproteobacteria bacterium]MBW2152596.1 DUF1641 domain-containing protein [Deltaproteobacteria bacterium]